MSSNLSPASGNFSANGICLWTNYKTSLHDTAGRRETWQAATGQRLECANFRSRPPSARMTAMQHYVDISFDCLPLRSLGRFDPPPDAAEETFQLCDRLRHAAAKHGLHNTYYLHRAACVFHLTNDAELGMVEFAFEGTVLTDADDLTHATVRPRCPPATRSLRLAHRPGRRLAGRNSAAGGACGIRPLHRRRRPATDNRPHGTSAGGDRGPGRLSGNGRVTNAQRHLGKVYLVGAGPGDPGLLTLRAAECLRQADLVLYDYLVNPLVLEHAGAEAELVCLGHHGTGRHVSQAEINARMIEAARRGRTVVRLKAGDPCVFGCVAEEAGALRAGGIPLEIIPGVTAGLAVAGYAEIPVTHAQQASAVALVTGHQRRDKHGPPLDYAALAAFPGTLVFYMGVTSAAEWSQALMAGGKSPDTPVAIVRRCSWADQQTVRCTLATLAGGAGRPAARPAGGVRRRRRGGPGAGGLLVCQPAALRRPRAGHPAGRAGPRAARPPGGPGGRGVDAAGDRDWPAA